MFESSAIPQEADLRLYLSRKQLAVRLNRTERTIIRYERRGMPSRELLGSNRKAYLVPEILEWLEGQPHLAKDCREVQLCG